MLGLSFFAFFEG